MSRVDEFCRVRSRRTLHSGGGTRIRYVRKNKQTHESRSGLDKDVPESDAYTRLRASHLAAWTATTFREKADDLGQQRRNSFS
jgi:hypothetical protein